MKCQMDYCIYNKGFSCILKETQLNPLGMCEECIIVSIADNELKELKERQLKEIEGRWKADKKGNDQTCRRFAEFVKR